MSETELQCPLRDDDDLPVEVNITNGVSGGIEILNQGKLEAPLWVLVFILFAVLACGVVQLTTHDTAVTPDRALQVAAMNLQAAESHRVETLQTRIVQACLDKGGLPSLQQGNVTCTKMLP